MIRWHFILTRLIIVMAVLALLRWGLGPVAKYVTVRGIESITGAKVEIAHTAVGLFPPRVQYLDVHVADPRDGKAMRNAIHADSIDLVIDGEALMQRRWVAREGRISGLEIGSRREISGHLEPTEDDIASASDGPSMLGQLIGSTTDKLAQEAKTLSSDLETLRRSKEIRGRWENEYRDLTARAKQLEKKIRGIRDRARSIDNPLRDWPQLESALAEAREAQNELINVRQTIDGLPAKLQLDLVALDEAKQIDLAKVARYVPGDWSDTSDFGVDMIADAVRAQVAQVKSYLDGGRTLANYTVVAPESERVRGVDFDLRPNPAPAVMIRRCEVGGMMRADGNLYAVTGIVENMTPTPQWLDEPTRARLRLEGPETLRVEYVRDRRSGADVDLLTLHWPGREAKPMQLGNPGDAGIAIQGGQRELWIQIRTEGDAIAGRLVSKQTGVKMDLTVHPKYAESAAAVSLRESLAAVDRIEIDANFSGNWRDLDLNLNTNLGQVLRDATSDAIDQQLQASKQQLIAKIEQTHQQQSAALRQWISQQTSETRTLLASADKTIEEMRQKVLTEVGDADLYLGRLRSAVQSRLR